MHDKRQQAPSDPAAIDVPRLQAGGVAARVEYFETLGSTQDRAAQLARENAGPLPCLVIAEEQTAGRGRGQNRWWTGRGSLAFSLLFDPANLGLPREPQPLRSLAVGAAIVATLAPLAPGHEAGLHWPNDVYLAGRKIAGVLVDVLGDGRHVVGIGVNVNNSLAAAPDEVRARATSLVDLTGREHDRTSVLSSLLTQLKATLHESGASPEAFGERYNELCLQRSRPLTIEVAGQRTTGLCTGIASDGALLLETPAGLQKFYTGVLVHGRID